MRAVIRDANASDVAALHRINDAGTPGVGSVTASELAHLIDIGAATLVAEIAGAPAGFILCMTEGIDYPSLNYQWISGRRPTFAYCDRIAVASGAQGCGLGATLYRAAFARFAGQRGTMLCEVNLAPPNPGSLRFHERLGFTRIGEQWTADGQKGVVFLERALASD